MSASAPFVGEIPRNGIPEAAPDATRRTVDHVGLEWQLPTEREPRACAA
jgi:hypothetical protein